MLPQTDGKKFASLGDDAAPVSRFNQADQTVQNFTHRRQAALKTLRPLLLIAILILAAIPLVIAAQDNSPSQPSSTLVIGTANPCWDCIEYPDNHSVNLTPGQINLPLAQTPTEELIEYPTRESDALADTCGHDDPSTIFVPICPPTATPKPQNQSSAVVNGLWIQEPGGESFSSSGQCRADYGDNDGPPNYGSEDEIPRVPACVSGDNQWLSVNNNGPFPRVLEGIYSTQEFSRSLIETGGETTGSVNVTTRREYRVISPTQIEFSYTISEDGGCTRTSTIRYKLVAPNEMVCSGTLITPEATLMSTPVATAASTAQPGETPAPIPTVQP
ncbi:MAG: hypothetical protein K8I30_15945, partial [Anaerolineae bacterium]|nr:hypothetical protein [Anaerolineae bacterium]